MVIVVRKLVDACATNADGEVVYAAILDELARHSQATVDFSGMLNATSSFVNCAFVQLLDHMSATELRSRVRIVQAHPQIAKILRDRITSEERRQVLVA